MFSVPIIATRRLDGPTEPVFVIDNHTATAGETASAGDLECDINAGEGRFAAGTILAERYRVISRLGRGGMGEVYRATDLKLSQAVALKLLPARLSADGLFLARMGRRRDAAAVAVGRERERRRYHQTEIGSPSLWAASSPAVLPWRRSAIPAGKRVSTPRRQRCPCGRVTAVSCSFSRVHSATA